MPELGSRLAAVALALIATPIAQAAPVIQACGTDRHACAVDAYRAGDLTRARATLDGLLAEAPDNVDALLLSGNLHLRAGELDAARRTLDRAALLAPDYADVRVARARLDLREGRLGAAQRDIAKALALSPANADALALRDQIADARGDVRWSAGLDRSTSWLSPRRAQAWHETLASLSHRRGPAAVAVEVEHARRFGRTDVRVQLRGDRRLGPASIYAAVVATPDADFRERWGLRAGGSLAAHARIDVLIDGRFSEYRDASGGSVTLGARLWSRDHRSNIRATLINFVDDAGRYRIGAAADASIAVTPRLRVQGGYAQYPEIELGITRRIESVSAGAAYQAGKRLTLRAGLERESRGDAYRRRSVTVGLSLGF